MTVKSLQDYIYVTKYARHRSDLGRRETFEESVDRVIDMHRTKYAGIDIEEELAFCSAAIKDRLVLGSQRALQFGGTPILKKEARIFNCTTSYADRPRFFQECLWLLLCGCGAGFSVQRHHIAKLPNLHAPKYPEVTYQIPDTIEGWADALGMLLASYGIAAPEFTSNVQAVKFDYSIIRPEGSPLASGSGKAPGPVPLRVALEKIRVLLDGCLKDGREMLRPIDAYDIVMHASDAVLSGGVRRSATICMFSVDDQEMMEAKTGNWFVSNPQRGRSNNSAVLLRDSTSRETFNAMMKSVKEFGEPGFVWADSTEIVYNPCVEIGLYPTITIKDLADLAPAAVDHIVDPRTGEQATRTVSGWAFCVSGDTKLLTRTGITSIKDAVGADTEVWNGKRWSMVKPFETGKNRKLYRVRFSDGSYLDATANHKWLVKDRFMADYKEVQTVDLLSVSKYQIHVPRTNMVMDGGKREESAYEYGILLGDGDARHDHAARVQLYGRKKALPVRGSRGIDHDEYQTVTLTDVDQDFARTLKWSGSLPSELFAWDRDSILRFVAGWADTDGSQASNGIRIYGQEQRLRDLQLLLTKAGIDCSVNLMAEAGAVTNFGHRQQDMWYAQVTDAREIPCHRLDVSKGKPATCKGKYQIVESVDELPGRHDTYCLTEDEAHLCVFNNVLTKQCNLCEINMKACSTRSIWERACTAAALLGTMQAGYSNFEYLGPVSSAIAKREALLGCSMTGMMDNPKLAFDVELQQQMAVTILAVNEKFAPKIGVRPTARATCVKPAGTTSCILGTSSGIHAHHAKRYFRRAQGNKLEGALKYFEMHNPRHVEASVWSANKTDKSVIFCIEVADEALTKGSVNAIKLLEYVKLTQNNWVAAGRVKSRCAADFLRHNVSNTINVQDSEWDDVAAFIYDNRDSFAGISLLSHSGDKDYPQAPFCEVFTPAEILVKYGDGSLMASGLIVDGQHAFENDLWAACSSVLGLGQPLNGALPDDMEADDMMAELNSRVKKIDWVRRAKKFAKNYFSSDLKKMTYCLKDVSNYKLWVDLTREYTAVDWSMFIEDQDNTKNVSLDAACAGGKCDVL